MRCVWFIIFLDTITNLKLLNDNMKNILFNKYNSAILTIIFILAVILDTIVLYKYNKNIKDSIIEKESHNKEKVDNEI